MFSANLRHWRPTLIDHFVVLVSVIGTVSLCTYLLYIGSTSNTAKLPLNTSCNLLEQGCSKGDLIDMKIADCKKDGPNANIYTCDSLNNLHIPLSDLSDKKMQCNANTERPIVCGTPGTNTRCVCYKADQNLKGPKETALNGCRCQYWPEEDIRENQPNFCTQFDHGGQGGGKTILHIYTCCNNCLGSDKSCNGHTYQGGGATDAYCDVCGRSNSKLHVSGEGAIIYAFNCVNCSQQNVCEEKCHHKWNGSMKEIPGLSAMWADCFRDCCLNAAMIGRI